MDHRNLLNDVKNLDLWSTNQTIIPNVFIFRHKSVFFGKMIHSLK